MTVNETLEAFITCGFVSREDVNEFIKLGGLSSFNIRYCLYHMLRAYTPFRTFKELEDHANALPV